MGCDVVKGGTKRRRQKMVANLTNDHKTKSEFMENQQLTTLIWLAVVYSWTFRPTCQKHVQWLQ